MSGSASAEPSTPDEPSIDIILNRQSVALARAQRVLQSWLPPAPPEETARNEDQDSDDEKPMNEAGGLGSKAAQEDVDDFRLPRRKHCTNDKLLEQILGKKGAAAKRKRDAQEGKSAAASKYRKALPLVEKPKPEKTTIIESHDEEGGRATAFKSRQRRPIDAASDQQVQGKENSQMDGITRIEPDHVGTISKSTSNPPKKKTSSYLDEVLAQKSKKKRSKSAQPG